MGRLFLSSSCFASSTGKKKVNTYIHVHKVWGIRQGMRLDAVMCSASLAPRFLVEVVEKQLEYKASVAFKSMGRLRQKSQGTGCGCMQQRLTSNSSIQDTIRYAYVCTYIPFIWGRVL